MEVSIERSDCISCGLCVSTCPDVFRIAEGGMPRQGRPDGSGLCDDEGDVAQYLGMDAFFNLM